MRVSVCEKTVSITEMTVVCEGDYGVNVCMFDLPESFNNLNVTAVFNGISVPLVNKKCIIPPLCKGNVTLGVFAYKRENDELKLMYSPKPTAFYVSGGSFCEESAAESVPEISRFDEFCGMLAAFCSEQIKEHCNLKKICNPKIYELDYGVYSVLGDVIYSEGEQSNIGVESAVMFVLPVDGSVDESKKCFYLFADNNIIYKGVAGISAGFAEELPTFADSLTSACSEKTYPSSKAVYDFVLQEYIADSDRPVSGKVMESQLEKHNKELLSGVHNTVAGALKSSKTGRAVTVGDVSSLSHDACVTLKNTENLCSVGSVAFTSKLTVENAVVIPKGKYVFSAVVKSTDTDKENCYVCAVNSKTGYAARIFLPHSSGDERVSCAFSVSQDIDRFDFYASEYGTHLGKTASFTDIKTEVGSVASEYTPYIDLSTVKISVCGKNLFPDFIKSKTYSDGSVITVNVDGSVSCNMVEGTYVSVSRWIRLPAGTYTISDGKNGGTTPYIAAIFYGDKNDTSTRVAEINTRTSGFQTVTTGKTCDVKLLLYTGSAEKSTFKLYPQLEVGADSTEYECYKSVKEYFSSEKGTVTVMSEYPNMTVFTDTEAINVETGYNKDINKAFEEIKDAIISLGGNI